jgi:phosphoribosylglycinamide formyltransferase-1
VSSRPGPLRVVVVISGSGTNLQALLDRAADSDAGFRVVGVVSNRPRAAGLDRARDRGISVLVVDHTEFADRAAFDLALADAIDALAPDLVVLAGFMRILTDAFVHRFTGRMINIHPSLLPAFQGLQTHRRALDAGVTEHGASVHFVTAELDGGPLIAQARVPVMPGDDETTLAERVLAREHRLLPQVVEWFAAGRLRLQGNRVLFDERPLDAPLPCDD